MFLLSGRLGFSNCLSRILSLAFRYKCGMEGCWLTLGDLEAGARDDGIRGEGASGPLCYISISFLQMGGRMYSCVDTFWQSVQWQRALMYSSASLMLTNGAIDPAPWKDKNGNCYVP